MIRALLLSLFLLVPVFAAEVNEDPLERQVLDIAKDLRCAVCQNQSLDESNADLALDMRKIIREQIVAGKSRQEILDYFVARYGDYILMKPPYSGAGFIVWLGPLVLLLALGASAFVYLRYRVGKPMTPPPRLSAEDMARVRAARGEEP